MKKYQVTITETLEKSVEVEAETQEQAQQIVLQAWKDGEYILDADSFTGVDFEAKETAPEKMKVVLLEPGKLARTAEIGTSLKDLQTIVGGNIEAAYYFDEPVCVVLNDEGKLQGLPLNRGIYDEDKKLVDIISGTAFICDCSGENFGSLSDEQLKKYTKDFKYPEKFYRINNEIKNKTYRLSKKRPKPRLRSNNRQKPILMKLKSLGRENNWLPRQRVSRPSRKSTLISKVSGHSVLMLIR